MTNSPIQTYLDIDWATIRQNAMAQMGWKRKGPEEWDKKAESFSGRTKNSDYADLFIDELPLAPSVTVLDVGSGPGTLALPIAKRVKKVTALDFSAGMLEILEQHAAKERIQNITSLQWSWEDDWQEKGIHHHDIAIASRSVGVDNLEAALAQLNQVASKYVFISDRIGATPFEAGAFHAIGRNFEPGPDYIYTLNILYTMGIHPNVKVLRPDPLSVYPSIESARNSYRWMFQDLSQEEENKLTSYLLENVIKQDPDGSITIKRNSPVQWALIWWHKGQPTLAPSHFSTTQK